MVHGAWNPVRKMRQVGSCGSERGREDNAMDVLGCLISTGTSREGRRLLGRMPYTALKDT